MKRVLVTGGDGFVARHVVPEFLKAGWSVRSAVRRSGERALPGVETLALGDFRAVDWAPHVKGVDVVVHLAARAHRMANESDDVQAYRRDNVEVTTALARAAASAGVKRLIFLSSVKAMGQSTPIDAPWTEESECRPADAYGDSKRAAENELRGLGLPLTILRVPLIYGAGVKANFRRLFSLVSRRVPLPFASINNSRSLLYAGNLADILIRTAGSASADGTFLVSDGEDLSTPELIRRMARASGVSPRLLAAPAVLLSAGARLIGKSEEARRLVESLRIDSSKIRRTLEWSPPYTVDAGLSAMVRDENAR